MVVGLLGLFIVFCTYGNDDNTPESVAQDFFNYLLVPTTDIAEDDAAQRRWLTTNLRKSLIETARAVDAARRLPEVDGPDPARPDNHTFLDSWDAPTTCLTTNAQATNTMAQIGMLCRWGRETNYPDASRNVTVKLLRQDGNWRIADIHMHQSNYGREFSLENELLVLQAEANALSKQAAGTEPKTARPAEFKH